jgi:DNA repair exonuclease SbcCD nuclease subunit
VKGPAWHGTACLCPLLSVAQLARDEECDLLIIAGDLFDNNRVALELVVRAFEILESLPMLSLIIPGNHDAYDETSVYQRASVNGGEGRLHVVRRSEGELIEFDSLSLSVWARPVIRHDFSNRPLSTAPPHPGRGWYVVVGHGEFVGDASNTWRPRSSPISALEINQTGADYIALGHWDATTAVGGDPARAWYSGAPHGGGEHQHALSVTLDVETGLVVEQVPTQPAGRSVGGPLIGLCSG